MTAQDYMIGIYNKPSTGLTTEQSKILDMTKYQNKAVYLDPEVLVSGDGSATKPFKTVTETKDFAETNGILTVYIYSDVTIEGNVKNFTVIGIGTPKIDCGGFDLKNTEFVGCELVGTYTGNIKLRKCEIGTGFIVNAESIDIDNRRALRTAKETWEYEQGGWEIDAINFQMIMKKQDGSELQRFNCFDQNGNPSIISVRKMVKV